MATVNHGNYDISKEYKDETTQAEYDYDLTEYEMRAERLRQASSHIAEYARKLEELNMRREKTLALIEELGVRVSELRITDVPESIIEDLYGTVKEGYSDGYKNDPRHTVIERRHYSDSLNPHDS